MWREEYSYVVFSNPFHVKLTFKSPKALAKTSNFVRFRVVMTYMSTPRLRGLRICIRREQERSFTVPKRVEGGWPGYQVLLPVADPCLTGRLQDGFRRQDAAFMRE